jgi:hypothetical protein
MAELVFNIRQLFTTDKSDGCLAQYRAEKYWIPEYQRGYKWGSEVDGAVSVLLRDLWKEFEREPVDAHREYYLQYVTVKFHPNQKHLEVIDGQQRLTTLTILLSILALHRQNDNISKGKLAYAIRGNFVSDCFGNPQNLADLLAQPLQDVTKFRGLKLNAMPSIFDSQDIFFLFAAAHAINKFIDKEVKGQQDAFQRFILDQVKIIVNSVEAGVDSERIFANLNSNRVPLTESELIKGLWLTRVGRKPGAGPTEKQKSFREIQAHRMLLGRQWDEISSWCRRTEVQDLLFGGADGLERLLEVTLLTLNNGNHHIRRTGQSQHNLFNFFNERSSDADAYATFIDNYHKLRDWFETDQVWQELGFCLVLLKGKPAQDFIVKLLMTRTKNERAAKIKEKILELIPSNTDELSYSGDNHHGIEATLLALSVFAPGYGERFDYSAYVLNRWTYEHIIPQMPEGTKRSPLTEKEKVQVLNILRSAGKLTPEIEQVLTLETRNAEEIKLYANALKETGILDGIGNMCLLASADNSANGNLSFAEKRKKVLERIRRGSFIPKHTYDVFNKAILAETPGELDTWSKADIESHRRVVANEIATIRENLS